MRKLVRSSVLVALAIAATVMPSAAAHASSYTPDSYAARLLALFNATRQQHGLSPVSLAAGTTTVAAAWSQHLAQADALSHNPNLRSDLESHGSADWHVYGENVGDADTQDPDGLFDAYMASPEHRANILTKEFRYLGNAVVFAGGRAWNTMDLVDAYSTGTSSAKAAPKPAPVRVKAAPRPVTTKPATRPAAVKHTAAAARPLPRSDRGTTRALPRTPLAVPRATGEPAAVQATHELSVPAPFDGERVLLLAVAAMLALQVGGLWVGCALRPRRVTVRS